MRRLLPLALLVGLFVNPTRAAAQLEGIFEIPCPTALTRYWYEYQPVEFEGYAFDTNWVSDFVPDGTQSVPSRNWYSPVPDPYPKDVTGQVRWYASHVLVHCQVERNYYGIRAHLHPVDFRGFIQACRGGTRHDDMTLYESGYDPYSPDGSSAPDGGDGGCDGGGGGDGGGPASENNPDGTIGVVPGSGGGSRSMCPDNQPYYWDIDCLDLYVEGVGWVEYWCGAVMVCG